MVAANKLVAFCVAVVLAGAALAQNAEIRPSEPNTIPEMRNGFSRGRFELRNATMVDLIRTAWGVDADKVMGGPDWLELDRFDVAGPTPAGSTQETLRAMLRGLLEERFRLVLRKGMKQLPAYTLTAAKKVLLQQADGSGPTGCVAGPYAGQGAPVEFTCRNMTMEAFVSALAGMREASGYLLNHPVVDRTGLQGAWNFSVKWSSRNVYLANAQAGETVTLFDAFEKQLGLRLTLASVPTPVLIVGSVNRQPAGAASRAAGKLPEFEVADIKPDAAGAPCGHIAIQPGGRVRIVMNLMQLVQEAWDYVPERIVGGPRFMDDTCFVIVAKASSEENARAGWDGPVWNGVDIDTMRKMLRSLLKDRFGLVARFEDRPVAGYALVKAKPRLRKADPANRAGCREGPGADGKDPRLTNPMVSRLVTCRSMTLAQFAAVLSGELFRVPPVIDATGIAGRYDLTVSFSPGKQLPPMPSQGTDGNPVASEPDGSVSFSDALRTQLGLRLESRKVMAPVLVIDRVNEMPTEN